MRFFALTFDRIFLRFILMMTCVIGGLFIGQPWIAFFALPLFLSALLGVSFKAEAKPLQTAVVKKNINTVVVARKAA